MIPFHGSSTTSNLSKIYTVNGGVAPGQNQPDWLGSTITRAHREKSKKKKKPIITGNEGKSLIQDFDFPEASNKIKSTSDGKFLIATGTYKPRMKVFELDELAMKFDRVTDSENVDFCILSTDWTKTIHLQTDRTLDIHTQTASHYRVRIPKHGRALAYHFPSCDAICGGTGSQVWRLNLEEGRFLAPFELLDDVTGVSAIDINPVHGLIGLGTETENGQGTVEFWDHRARSRSGILRLPYSRLLGLSNSFPTNNGLEHDTTPVSVTALASKLDGLTIAVGTSTGHTLLYDLRAPAAHTIKDQGYGLPIKKIEWPTSVSVTGFDQTGDLVATADSKVVKIWRSHTTENLISVNPVSPVNDMHIYPDSGLIVLANEAGPMTGYFVPSLGPAPKWCRFLENMTEEMEESKEVAIYDDYKFVSDAELKSLNLDHLVGTPALRPYMHGYFVDLRLYAKAKAIANPFAYIEHREKLAKQQLEKEQESRIRTSRAKANAAKSESAVKDAKINKELLQRILDQDEETHEQAEIEGGKSKKKKAKANAAGPTRSLLEDERFGELFTNEDFEIDEFSTEFAALNPSLAAAARSKPKPSLNTDSSDYSDEDGGSEDEGEGTGEESESEDSSDDDLWKKSRSKKDRASESKHGSKTSNTGRTRGMISAPQEQQPQRKPRMFIVGEGENDGRYGDDDRNRSIGRKLKEKKRQKNNGSLTADGETFEGVVETFRSLPGGGMEVSFIPSNDNQKSDQKKASKVKPIETFGVGLTKGPMQDPDAGLEGESKSGRTKRRRIERSASKNRIRSF